MDYREEVQEIQTQVRFLKNRLAGLTLEMEEDGKDTALIVIVSADGEHYNGWEGTTDVVDDHVVLYSDDEDAEIPFTFSDADDTGTFTLSFLGDGDEAAMQFVDWDSFVEDVVAARRSFD